MNDMSGPVESRKRWIVLSLAALFYVALIATVTPFLANAIQRENLAGGGLMPLGASVAFFALCAGNVWRRRRARVPFTTPAETLAFFIIILVSTWTISWAFVEAQMPLLTAPYVFASPENGWEQHILPNLPAWAMGPAVEPYASAYYNGLPAGIGMPWSLWIRPVVSWTLFSVALALFGFGLGAAFSRQWIEHDRIPFPHAEIFLGMVKNFLLDRRFWYGVAIAAAIPTWNLFQQLYPVFPRITLLFGSDLKGVEWFKGAVGIIPVLNLTLLGLFYFVHRDIVISMCIFFFLQALEKYGLSLAGAKLVNEDVFASGWGDPVGWQTAGATFMLVLFGIWSGRRSLMTFIRKGLKGDDDESSWLSPRAALVAFGAGTIGLAAWHSALGIRSFGPLLAFMVSLPLWLLGGARVTMESAMEVQIPGDPTQFALLAGGTLALLPVGCIALALTSGWMTSWTSHAANVLQAGRFRSQFRMPRALFVVVLAGVALATAIAMYSTAFVCYEYGANSFGNWAYEWHMRIPFDRATEGTRTPFLTDPGRIGWLGLGMGIMSALIFLRNRVVGWFLHPVGFILSTLGINPDSKANEVVFTGFIAWGLKTLVLRLGGVEAYERFKPFFGGLVVGHFLPNILGLFMNVVSYIHQGRPLGG